MKMMRGTNRCIRAFTQLGGSQQGSPGELDWPKVTESTNLFQSMEGVDTLL